MRASSAPFEDFLYGESVDRQFAGVKKPSKSYSECQKRKPMEFQVGDMVMLKVSPWKGVIRFGKRELPDKLRRIHNTFHVSNLKKYLADENLVIPLEEIQLDNKLHFIKELVEIIDREVKQLKQSRIPIVKVRWNLRRGPEYTRREESQKKLTLIFPDVSTSIGYSVSNFLFNTAYSSQQINTAYPLPLDTTYRSSRTEVDSKFSMIDFPAKFFLSFFRTNPTDCLSLVTEYSEEEEAEAMAEIIEQYKSKTRTDYGSGVARPKIDNKDQFELKDQFLKELRENTFSCSDNEDANENIEKVLEIVNLFHVLNITKDQLMLRVFPISLTGAASRWLRNEPTGSIKT
ncbi:hypothetical protein Tco_0804752 [Tanacetum coccineum]|uniref:Reverse transcriptase domain-containing protein n=1 Tax=Tanacetum coccineum TaxID=301880 RepID=A0ABQ5A566_9ASTR